MFNAFIKSIAIAIDEKSPFTGGHIKRVVTLTELIIEAINADQKGAFKAVALTKAQKEELLLAAWMHDVGKITTPDVVMDKASRLFSEFDRIHLLETRSHLIYAQERIRYLLKMIRLMKKNRYTQKNARLLSAQWEKTVNQIQDDFDF